MKFIATFILLCALAVQSRSQTPWQVSAGGTPLMGTISYGDHGFTITPVVGTYNATCHTLGYGDFGTNVEAFSMIVETNSLGQFVCWQFPSVITKVKHAPYVPPPVVFTLTATGTISEAFSNPPGNLFIRAVIEFQKSSDLVNWAVLKGETGNIQTTIQRK
jgi:hypothetical protein